MLKRVHIICHSMAGQGKGRRTLKQVEKILAHYEVPTIVYDTIGMKQASMYVKRIVTQGGDSFTDDLLVIGGDGTLHDVVQALCEIQHKVPLSYIPAGTGNDFGRAWLKGQKIEDIVHEMLFEKQITQIPIISFYDHYYDQPGVLLNSMGFGVDALANKKTQEITAKLNSPLNRFLQKTQLSYVVGLFASLTPFPHFPLDIEMGSLSYHFDDVSLIAVINNPYLGGGIKLDNLTNPDFDQVVVMVFHDINAKAAFDLIPRVLFWHNQDQSRHVFRMVGPNLKIRIPESIQGQVDGEAFKFPQSEFTFKMDTYPLVSGKAAK